MPSRAETSEAESPTVETPGRVFSRELLAAVRGLDAVSGQDEAERARPLSIEAVGSALWHVVTVGTEAPLGRFTDRELAALFCAAYPSAVRDASLELGREPEDGGYPLWWSRGSGREKCGELPHFDAETVQAMKCCLSLARNPLGLSYLLEVVGWPALEAACEILLERQRADGTLPEGDGS